MRSYLLIQTPRGHIAQHVRDFDHCQFLASVLQGIPEFHRATWQIIRARDIPHLNAMLEAA